MIVLEVSVRFVSFRSFVLRLQETALSVIMYCYNIRWTKQNRRGTIVEPSLLRWLVG